MDHKEIIKRFPLIFVTAILLFSSVNLFMISGKQLDFIDAPSYMEGGCETDTSYGFPLPIFEIFCCGGNCSRVENELLMASIFIDLLLAFVAGYFVVVTYDKSKRKNKRIVFTAIILVAVTYSLYMYELLKYTKPYIFSE